MSGLSPDTCRILEIASVVTDANLDVIATGPISSSTSRRRSSWRWTTGTGLTTGRAAWPTR